MLQVLVRTVRGVVHRRDVVLFESRDKIGRRAGATDARFSSFDDRLNQAAQKVTRTLKRSSQK